MAKVYLIGALTFGSEVRFGADQGRSTTVTAVTIGTVIRSRLDTRSDEYRDNLAAMQQLWDGVAAELASVPTIGGQRYVDRHRRRGKMLVRERIEALVDPTRRSSSSARSPRWGTQDPDRREQLHRHRRRRGRRVRDQWLRHDLPRRLEQPDDGGRRGRGSTRSPGRTGCR
jgi:hypothetical protein